MEDRLLDALFIIDGVAQEMSLRDCLCLVCHEGQILVSGTTRASLGGDIIDESILEDLSTPLYRPSGIRQYSRQLLSALAAAGSNLSLTHSAFTTLRDCECAIISAMLCKGVFSLGELQMDLRWRWDVEKLGNAASLYYSVRAVCEFLESAGVGVSRAEIALCDGEPCKFIASVSGTSDNGGFMDFVDSVGDLSSIMPRGEAFIDLSSAEIPFEVKTLPSASYLVYVPFEPVSPMLAGSAFSAYVSHVGSGAAELGDADYFSDCFQVCRELIQDRIVHCAAVTGPGGIYTAACSMMSFSGARLDADCLKSVASTSDVVRILFGEIPGVLMQLSESDSEYFDSQMLLQDVAYYRIAEICRDFKGLRIAQRSKDADISRILNSLLQNQTTEGED